ncbi:MAG: tyrosine-type recombinase/integrase, partial [Actinobacteria bacterium]|nr:tyrosine-type recombinase/integrase [Actinomycetota bacterium]
TIENYLAGLDRYISWAPKGGTTPVGDVSANEVRQFITALQDKGLSPATVNTRFRGLRQFFKWAESEEEIQTGPMLKLKQPTVPPSPVPVLADGDVAALLATCEGRGKTSFIDRRDAAVLRVLLDTGIRRAELEGIRVDDVDLAERMVTVTGKGSRTRTIRYGLKTAQALDRYVRVRASKRGAEINPALWLSDRGGTTWTKSGIRMMLARRSKEAGLDYVPHPHQFRHTFADDYLRSGGLEGDLMRVAGWRSRQMVDRYGASVAEARAQDSRDRLELKGDRL